MNQNVKIQKLFFLPIDYVQRLFTRTINHSHNSAMQENHASPKLSATTAELLSMKRVFAENARIALFLVAPWRYSNQNKSFFEA